MYFCQIFIDILDDEYYYSLIIGFLEKELCENFFIKINNKDYSSKFSKNCIFIEKIENSKTKNIFENTESSTKFLENCINDVINLLDRKIEFKELEN